MADPVVSPRHSLPPRDSVALAYVDSLVAQSSAALRAILAKAPQEAFTPAEPSLAHAYVQHLVEEKMRPLRAALQVDRPPIPKPPRSVAKLRASTTRPARRR